MLKCFTLTNALRGLTLLIRKITPKNFIISTVVLEQASGDLIEETIDTFDFKHLGE